MKIEKNYRISKRIYVKIKTKFDFIDSFERMTVSVEPNTRIVSKLRMKLDKYGERNCKKWYERKTFELFNV